MLCVTFHIIKVENYLAPTENYDNLDNLFLYIRIYIYMYWLQLIYKLHNRQGNPAKEPLHTTEGSFKATDSHLTSKATPMIIYTTKQTTDKQVIIIEYQCSMIVIGAFLLTMYSVLVLLNVLIYKKDIVICYIRSNTWQL